jgi:hypothetical protein
MTDDESAVLAQLTFSELWSFYFWSLSTTPFPYPREPTRLLALGLVRAVCRGVYELTPAGRALAPVAGQLKSTLDALEEGL